VPEPFVAGNIDPPLELRRDGIEMIAPHRTNRRKPPTQDGRRLSCYTRPKRLGSTYRSGRSPS
jgi:hypothetical protein